ncbi:MAG: tetratricopeptide repeat protein [Planctomycetes bacterium]|nr:tetratricopeptide repeat protein [Planctomycetota bacterium]
MNPRETFQAAARSLSAGDWGQAEVLCRQLLAANPQHADALHMLGHVFNQTGRTQEALAKLREAIELRPANAILWLNLGEFYRKAEQFADAVECQLRAISLQPNFPEAQINLSLAYDGLGQHDDAIAAARRATELRPNYPEAHSNLGNLLREQGRLQEAVAAYQTALGLRADLPDAHQGMAMTVHDLRRYDDAVVHFREALRLGPERTMVQLMMGRAFLGAGRVREAKATLEQAAARADQDSRLRQPISRLFRETLADVIPRDHASIEECRSRIKTAIETFAAGPGDADLSELHLYAGAPNAMLAYYGVDVRPILEQYAQAVRPLIPPFSPRPRQGRPKLGIIAPHGNEVVFAKCWGGIAERLSREIFDVKLVCSQGGARLLQNLLKVPESEYLCLPAAVDHAAHLLHKQEFDWLHYWEIGTDAMNYYLPFFQTAPGQSGCWGWPVTSGNRDVNSYLSCEQLEPPDGATHYTEELVLLKRLPTYYFRRPVPERPVGKERLGLQSSQHVYLCAQNLRKYHPDFDALLAAILRSDHQGVLLVVGDRQTYITELLIQRFRRTIPDVMSRLGVVPWMGQAEYLSLVAACDVILDTLHYGGGANTVYDAVAVGSPIVTMPGEFHRSRWAAAVNRRLGLAQLIASTPEEYVAKAIEVASNPDLRHSLHQQIIEAGAELFEDAAVVQEHNEYFSEAIAASREG